ILTFSLSAGFSRCKYLLSMCYLRGNKLYLYERNVLLILSPEVVYSVPPMQCKFFQCNTPDV
ncbi:unnamed protein product, partial [Brassica oleracea]